MAIALWPRHRSVEIMLIDRPFTQADHRIIHRDIKKLSAPGGFGLPQAGKDAE